MVGELSNTLISSALQPPTVRRWDGIGILTRCCSIYMLHKAVLVLHVFHEYAEAGDRDSDGWFWERIFLNHLASEFCGVTQVRLSIWKILPRAPVNNEHAGIDPH